MTIFGRPIFYGWVVVVAAFVAQFVTVGVQTSVIAVFAPEFIEEFGWSRTQFFLADSVGQALLMIIGFLIGSRIERIGARPIMLSAAVIAIPSLILMSQIDEYWQYLVVRGVFLVTSASVAGFLVVAIAVSKWFVVKRGQALGWTSMGVSMAGFFWPTFAADFLIAPLGWRNAWIVLAVCFAVIFIPAALLMRRRPEDHGLIPDGGAAQLSRGQIEAADRDEVTSLTRCEALRTRCFYLIVLIFGISVVGIFAILLNGVLFLREHGFTSGEAARAVAAFSLLSMVTKPPWGWALDRFDTRVVGFVSFLIGAAGFVLVINAAPTGDWWIIAGALAVMGLGIGGNIPISGHVLGRVLWPTLPRRGSEYRLSGGDGNQCGDACVGRLLVRPIGFLLGRVLHVRGPLGWFGPVVLDAQVAGQAPDAPGKARAQSRDDDRSQGTPGSASVGAEAHLAAKTKQPAPVGAGCLNGQDD